MVKHIVMFKLKEKTAENMEAAVSTLRGLDGKIESLRFIEVGVDFKVSERSYDLVLTTHFDDQEGTICICFTSHPFARNRNYAEPLFQLNSCRLCYRIVLSNAPFKSPKIGARSFSQPAAIRIRCRGSLISSSS